MDQRARGQISERADRPCGDAAGVYIPATRDLRPATPPPEFDLPTALQSLRTYAALAPSCLPFTHYGPVQDVGAMLDRAAEEINVWADETRRAKGRGLDLDHAAAMVAERIRQRYAITRDDDPELAARYDRAAGVDVAGISRWLANLTGQNHL